jgi:hypothetical protein
MRRLRRHSHVAPARLCDPSSKPHPTRERYSCDSKKFRSAEDWFGRCHTWNVVIMGVVKRFPCRENAMDMIDRECSYIFASDREESSAKTLAIDCHSHRDGSLGRFPVEQ